MKKGSLKYMPAKRTEIKEMRYNKIYNLKKKFQDPDKNRVTLGTINLGVKNLKTFRQGRQL